MTTSLPFIFLQYASDHHDDAFVNGLTHGHDVGHGHHGYNVGYGLAGYHGHHGYNVGYGLAGYHGHHGNGLGYGLEDINGPVANFEEDVEPVVVHHGHGHGHAHHAHNHDYEPNFKFHYPTYEIPVHGDVVSDKDAKKIGNF